MKVILTAFGDTLTSDPLDWPDDTGPTVRMQLDLPRHTAGNYAIETFPEIAAIPVRKQGVFEFTGKYQILPDKTTAAVYRLVNI